MEQILISIGNGIAIGIDHGLMVFEYACDTEPESNFSGSKSCCHGDV